ncbi:MAG TPA: CHAT domain-containing tetratricopeptide repeat protein [Candidatus Polarisedimenticolaceae bacterium]|nr:CHAT domain-containing tetratricopeptide repeat protein [Candidatus Polarisedimenticolaceae bacterium]
MISAILASMLLEAGSPLEARLPAGDKTEASFVASFVPDRDGPWTFSVASPWFDAWIEIHRRGADGSTELVGRIGSIGLGVIDPRVSVDARSGDALEVAVHAQEALACGDAFTLTVAPGRAERPSRQETERRERRYLEDLLAEATAREDAGCRVRALLGLLERERHEGHYDRAQELADRALALAPEGADGEEVLRARSLTAKGRLLREQGKYGEALPLLEQALALLDRHYGPQHLETGDGLEALSGLLDNMDRSEEAIALARRVLEIREQALPPGHLGIGFAVNNLAVFLMGTGELSAARTLMERVVSIVETQRPTDPEDVASALNNLGWAARRLGDYETARAAFERALPIFREADPKSRAVARTAGNLGGTLIDLGDLPGARRLYAEALAIAIEVYGPDHVRTAGFQLALARLDSWDGRFDEARARAEAALAVYEKTLSPGNTQIAQALERLAQIERDSGKSERALVLLDRALAIAEERFEPGHPELAEVWRERAAVQLDLGRSAAALASAQRAEEIGRANLQLNAQAMPESLALRYAATRPRGLDIALRIAASGPPPAADDVRAVWDQLIRSRTLVLDALAQRGHVRADDPRREAFRRSSALLARLLVRAAENDPPADIHERLEAARRARHQAEEQLSRESDAFRADQRAAEAGYEAVAGRLGPAEALLAYARIDLHAGAPHVVGTTTAEAPTEEGYLALVMRGDGSPPQRILLGSAAAIDGAVGSWRAALVQRPAALGPGATDRARRIESEGRRLAAAVWDPVAPALERVRTLFVVPDGSLHAVNLAALPARRGGYLVEGDPLIEPISAERDLLLDARRTESAPRALVLGGPDFDRAPRAIATSRGGGSPCGVGLEAFAPLPHAAEEAEEVATLLRRRGMGEVTALTGAAASEEAFKRLAPTRSLLHLATHGFSGVPGCPGRAGGPRGLADAGVYGVENPLALSGLALAGANRRRSLPLDAVAEDGILTAEEVAALDLSAAGLVVLSACDSALGSIAPGEGLLGLQRAFRVAGAHSLVLSLWRVPDQATQQWMKLAYEAMRAEARPAAALRSAARRWIAAERRAGAPADPAVWGAFVASGP